MASSSASSSVESSPSSQPSTRQSTVNSFKCPSLQNSRTHDVFQSIVQRRKNWKTFRGGEVVWPPELEAALIEGLENYQPDDSRETRLLGRFPMRNKFISDWIFEKTGKCRTAKQVGSRLQQLRDTCGGKRLLSLLSPNQRPCRTPSLSPEFQQKDGHLTYGPPSLRYESESCSESSASSPTTPTEAHASLQNLLFRGVEPRVDEIPDTIVYIDLLPDDAASPINGGGADEASSWSSTSQAIAEECSWAERGYKIERAAQYPRHLRDIDPTITLLSRSATTAKSHFSVHTDDGVIYTETTVLDPLDPMSAPNVDGALLYKTTLVPGFWETMSHSPDASQYVILQRVVQNGSSSSSAPSTIFCAMYKFNYVTLSPSPHVQVPHAHVHVNQTFPSHNTNMIPMDAAAMNPKADFSFDTLLSMDTGGFSDMMGFPKTPQTFFDLGSYMRSQPDWSTSSSSESVYPSPIDCNRPTQCGVMNGAAMDEQLLLSPPSFPVPNYVSNPIILLAAAVQPDSNERVPLSPAAMILQSSQLKLIVLR